MLQKSLPEGCVWARVQFLEWRADRCQGGSRPWPDVLQFRVGSGHREQMTVSGWMTILQTKEEEVRRSEITWPRPVLEVVPRHELTRNPGLTLKL